MPSEAARAIQRLRDIIENVDAALAFVGQMTSEEFKSDLKAHYATVRALEIISEASRHISDEIVQRHPKIAWHAVKAAGNVFRHGYSAVSLDLVWQTVQRDLTPLRAVAVEELARLGG